MWQVCYKWGPSFSIVSFLKLLGLVVAVMVMVVVMVSWMTSCLVLILCHTGV